MPAEAVKNPTPLGQANAQQQQTQQAGTPKKKPVTPGKTALAKVTLLDGSTLDVTIDVSSDSELIRVALRRSRIF